MGWKKIETAPRDGRKLLLRYEIGGAERVYIGQFHSKEVFEFGVSTGKQEYWTPPFDNSSIFGSRVQPTHWAKIPKFKK